MSRFRLFAIVEASLSEALGLASRRESTPDEIRDELFCSLFLSLRSSGVESNDLIYVVDDAILAVADDGSIVDEYLDFKQAGLGLLGEFNAIDRISSRLAESLSESLAAA